MCLARWAAFGLQTGASLWSPLGWVTARWSSAIRSSCLFVCRASGSEPARCPADVPASLRLPALHRPSTVRERERKHEPRSLRGPWGPPAPSRGHARVARGGRRGRRGVPSRAPSGCSDPALRSSLSTTCARSEAAYEVKLEPSWGRRGDGETGRWGEGGGGGAFTSQTSPDRH